MMINHRITANMMAYMIIMRNEDAHSHTYSVARRSFLEAPLTEHPLRERQHNRNVDQSPVTYSNLHSHKKVY